MPSLYLTPCRISVRFPVIIIGENVCDTVTVYINLTLELPVILYVIALLVMIVIAMLLIPQPMCSIWVAFAIASIDLGVIGFMTLWDVNLVKNCFTPKKILAKFFKINLAFRIKHLQLIRILGQTSFAPSLSSSQLALALRLE
ncbi:unnamed protein product [Gongylonema pulchrum]|uniref:G_PROTEIN_RECEP_F1_2 domain-containing protein n=1 Tax=Gongylonema pulchrum TaxID=637853 RepID=A0A183DH22_9BILA|nr:unnamed protein product [Gongylonema pulchrum]